MHFWFLLHEFGSSLYRLHGHLSDDFPVYLCSLPVLVLWIAMCELVDTSVSEKHTASTFRAEMRLLGRGCIKWPQLKSREI
jgi:hypothetical protein